MDLKIDHLVVTAPSLAVGRAYVEKRLGVPMQTGGKHPDMGTHNVLLSLGPDAYLEVIAIDPDATPPSGPRWYDLDNGAPSPRLTHWVLGTDDLPQALALFPENTGAPRALGRGTLRWDMSVPDGGQLPYHGAGPALIFWHGSDHPCANLTDHGLRLTNLEIDVPDGGGDVLGHLLTPDKGNIPIQFLAADTAAFRATIQTPNGSVVLS